MKKLDDLTELELVGLFNGIACKVEDSLPPGELFVLVVFGENGIGQYVSNACREDVVRAVREFADVMESRSDVERKGEGFRK